MHTVNRSVLIARGKEPFLKWVQNLPDPTDITMEGLNRENTIYLLPDYDCETEVEGLVRNHFKSVFRNELMNWWIDPADWPDYTDLELFKKWFHVEVHSMLRDLVPAALIRQEL